MGFWAYWIGVFFLFYLLAACMPELEAGMHWVSNTLLFTARPLADNNQVSILDH